MVNFNLLYISNDFKWGMIKAGSTWRGELHSLVLPSGASDLGPYSHTSQAYKTPFDKDFLQ